MTQRGERALEDRGCAALVGDGHAGLVVLEGFESAASWLGSSDGGM